MRKLPQLISRCYETHMNSFEKKREVKTSNCKNKFLSVFVVVVVFFYRISMCLFTSVTLHSTSLFIFKVVSTGLSLLHQNIRVASIPLPGTLNPVEKPFSSKEKK